MDPMSDTTITADPPTDEDAAKSAAIAKVQEAVAKVSQGDISYADLLALIAPPPPVPKAPANPPSPAVITDAQRAALARLTEVFGVCVPTERRALSVPEIRSLIDERLVLDEIEGMVKKRKEDGIRPAVFNHFDTLIDEAAAEKGEDYQLPPRDDKGYYITDEKLTVPDRETAFTRETRSGGVSLNPDTLRLLSSDPGLQAQLAEAGVTFTHDDYLAMTRPVRVLDEARVMIHLRKNPKLVAALQAATTTGPRTNSLQKRKA